MGRASQEVYDIAIVGAGVAGLYCAWRLLNENEPAMRPRIIVLEKLQRVGGRLRTGYITIDNKKIVVEEGGMRFLKSHARLMRLLHDVGLEAQVTPFGMGDDNNLYAIRGEVFSRQDSKDKNHRKWQEIYKLRSDERNKSPFQIIEGILEKITAPGQTLGDWRPDDPFSWVRLRQIEFPEGSGLRVYQWGFRALIEELGHSNECIQMLMDTGGFSVPYDDMVGAGTGLQLIASFPENPKFYTLEEGYEALPRELARLIRRSGGEIEMGYPVTSLERKKRILTIETEAHFGPTVQARKVIVALPANPMRRLLETVKSANDVKNVPTALEYLDKIVHMPLTKINLYFETRWWKQSLGIATGGCFTDLSLAQVYFFELDAADSRRQFSGITIYADGRRGNFWRQLQTIGADYQHPTKVHEIKPGTDLTICSTYVVEHALRQLKTMFEGLSNIPKPLYATISMWGGEEVGEGDHQWAVGANDEEIRDRLVEIDENVYLCGEAISDYQDWVEGALRSADHVLQRGFAMPPFIT